MTAYGTGILILRLILGLSMAAHGYTKIFGGGGLSGSAGWFASIGMKPGMLHAVNAASVEIAAGLALAVGLLTPVAAAGFITLMLVAAWTVHRGNGFFIVKNGWECNRVLAGSAVAVATVGPGTLSLDHALFAECDIYPMLQG